MHMFLILSSEGEKQRQWKFKMKKNTFLQTSSQTVGPFFAYGLTAQQYRYDFASLFNGNLRKNDIDGKEISIKGRVIAVSYTHLTLPTNREV